MLRIIAGSARGRKIETPPGLDTRPTLDRVRENLFNMLQGRCMDARVLDLFAGSGALSLEALSRGAAFAVLADRNVGTYLYDGSLVMGNLMNAAHSLGIASCWIHRAKEEFDSEEGKAILKSLGIEGDYEGIGHCILGYAAGECRPAAPRKENYIYRI